MLLFLNMLTNPITSQIRLFTTSHFSTLFECLIREEKSVTGRLDKLRLQKLGFYCIYKSGPKVELGATVKQIKPKEAAGLEPETARLQVQHSDHWATLHTLICFPLVT